MPDQGSFNFESTDGSSGPEKDRATREAEHLIQLESSKREVERALAVAESIGLNDPAAAPAFAHVETLVVKCADMEVHTRTFEKIGGFYKRRGDFATALKKYRVSLESAKCLSVVSDVAVEDEARLRFNCLKLEKLGDSAFENLKKAMRELTEPCSYWVPLKAWSNYAAQARRSTDRLAAHKLGSVEYFRKQLATAKPGLDDEEDDED